MSSCGPTATNHKNLLGSSRLLFALAGVLAWFLIAGLNACAQVSPGVLSKAHQSLSGLTQCATCHQFGTSTPAFKCLDCHKEIAQKLAARQGFHAQIGMKNPTGRDCVRCHLEHNGLDYALIHWEPSIKQFDHKLTGYPLVEKHAAASCEKCHTPAHMDPAERSLIKETNLGRSYLGLSKDCASCHDDPHKGQLGPACERCHNNFSDWKQAQQFDHSKTKYPLTGMHAQVGCGKCHFPSGPDQTVKYTGLEFETCTACHMDPHKGAFKGACESCHTTSGWKKVSMSGQFDHSKTKYPLMGMHLKVDCEGCHLSGDFKRTLPFALCSNCHSHDPHKGQFQARASKGECSECHTVNGWKPSQFGVKEHATSQYPLEGKHAAVTCEKCHIPAGKDTLYKIKFVACADCHQDAHDKQFAAAYQNRCQACHTVRDFHRATFTVAKHKDTRFALTGAHTAVSCADCHKPGLGGRTDKILPFHFEDRTCTACHTDPHKGEFKDRMTARRADGTPLGCEACHTTRSWIDVRNFDHSKTKFPLAGAHRTVACADCHKAAQGTHDIQFKGTPQNCEACHTDPHGAQFGAKDGSTKCAECHVVQRWTPSTFDHDKRTQFALQGGHANVGCSMCHALQREVQGRQVLFYKPTSTKCSDCHGANVRPL